MCISMQSIAVSSDHRRAFNAFNEQELINVQEYGFDDISVVLLLVLQVIVSIDKMFVCDLCLFVAIHVESLMA